MALEFDATVATFLNAAVLQLVKKKVERESGE
jgi:hypothetical protein